MATAFASPPVLVNFMLSSSDDYNDVSIYLGMKKTFEKSIVSASDLPKGTIIELKHLAFKKPGDGLPAKNYKKIVGLVLNRNLKRDDKIRLDYFNQNNINALID